MIAILLFKLIDNNNFIYSCSGFYGSTLPFFKTRNHIFVYMILGLQVEEKLWLIEQYKMERERQQKVSKIKKWWFLGLTSLVVSKLVCLFPSCSWQKMKK